jgi:hypothetical protein
LIILSKIEGIKPLVGYGNYQRTMKGTDLSRFLCEKAGVGLEGRTPFTMSGNMGRCRKGYSPTIYVVFRHALIQIWSHANAY